jgi:hypothetical protein
MALKIRNDQADSAAGLQHAHAFPQQPVQFVRIKVLEHVRGIDRIHGVRREWEPVSHVQTEIELVEKVAIDIDETRQILRPAAQMQMTGAPADRPLST